MITESRTQEYIESLCAYQTSELEEIRHYAEKHSVPILRRITESFLIQLLWMKKPKRILEVGTAIAYSTLIIAEHTQDDAEIFTIENYPPRIQLARENLQKSKHKERIKLLEGDAGEILPKLLKEKERFDFIFMDAAKAQYIHWLPDILDLMDAGAYLLSDNTLQDGEIAESRYAISRRNRGIHSNMRKYLYQLMHEEKLVSSVLPVGDGIALSVRREKIERD